MQFEIHVSKLGEDKNPVCTTARLDNAYFIMSCIRYADPRLAEDDNWLRIIRESDAGSFKVIYDSRGGECGSDVLPAIQQSDAGN
jgi:hypothetical protein